MRVICCGDRAWADVKKIRDRLSQLPSGTTVIEGDAPGADRIAGMIARGFGLNLEVHPAKWAEYGRAAGPIRNQEMLSSGVDLVLAFHSDLAKSKGTADMVRRTRKADISVEVIS